MARIVPSEGDGWSRNALRANLVCLEPSRPGLPDQSPLIPLSGLKCRSLLPGDVRATSIESALCSVHTEGMLHHASLARLVPMSGLNPPNSSLFTPCSLLREIQSLSVRSSASQLGAVLVSLLAQKTFDHDPSRSHVSLPTPSRQMLVA